MPACVLCSLRQWVFDSVDGSARLLKLRSGHGAPPSCVRHYNEGGTRLLSAGESRGPGFRVDGVACGVQSVPVVMLRRHAEAGRLGTAPHAVRCCLGEPKAVSAVRSPRAAQQPCCPGQPGASSLALACMRSPTLTHPRIIIPTSSYHSKMTSSTVLIPQILTTVGVHAISAVLTRRVCRPRPGLQGVLHGAGPAEQGAEPAPHAEEGQAPQGQRGRAQAAARHRPGCLPGTVLFLNQFELVQHQLSLQVQPCPTGSTSGWR